MYCLFTQTELAHHRSKAQQSIVFTERINNMLKMRHRSLSTHWRFIDQIVIIFNTPGSKDTAG